MNCSPNSEKQRQIFAEIVMFIDESSGLTASLISDTRVRVRQELDGKTLELQASDLDTMLLRSDSEGRDFIQVNFLSGQKILFTDRLIGFKPVPSKGVDTEKLPRVVTTPDIVSLFEAIQDALHSVEVEVQQVESLKRLFEAVLRGGEAVGIDLHTERKWLTRIPHHITRVSI